MAAPTELKGKRNGLHATFKVHFPKASMETRDHSIFEVKIILERQWTIFPKLS